MQFSSKIRAIQKLNGNKIQTRPVQKRLGYNNWFLNISNTVLHPVELFWVGGSWCKYPLMPKLCGHLSWMNEWMNEWMNCLLSLVRLLLLMTKYLSDKMNAFFESTWRTSDALPVIDYQFDQTYFLINVYQAGFKPGIYDSLLLEFAVANKPT